MSVGEKSIIAIPAFSILAYLMAIFSGHKPEALAAAFVAFLASIFFVPLCLVMFED